MIEVFSGLSALTGKGVFLQFFTIRELIYQWEAIGVFDLLLPFLLIFAVVFGILSYMHIFGNNRGIHALIALVIGLMATRFEFFTQFYQEIFPRLGIGIIILLAIMILLGMFFTRRGGAVWSWILIIVAAVILIVILNNTFNILGWTGFSYFGGGSNFAAWIITAVLIIGVIVVVVMANESDSETRRARRENPDFDHPHPFFGKRK